MAREMAPTEEAAYTALMKCNVVVNRIRSAFGLPYWSLSMVAKNLGGAMPGPGPSGGAEALTDSIKALTEACDDS